MKPLEKLDKLVEKNLKGIKRPRNIRVSFETAKKPGAGSFTINAKIEDIGVVYTCDSDEIQLSLKSRSDYIVIFVEDGTVCHVDVNDQEYYEKYEDEDCENWKLSKPGDKERLEALEYGAKTLKDFRNYLKGAVPELVRLMGNYFARTLVPMDDLMPARSNAQVFENLDLQRKLNKSPSEKPIYGRAKT